MLRTRDFAPGKALSRLRRWGGAGVRCSAANQGLAPWLGSVAPPALGVLQGSGAVLRTRDFAPGKALSRLRHWGFGKGQVVAPQARDFAPGKALSRLRRLPLAIRDGSQQCSFARMANRT
ncbi:MAG TPA: hypothetical protein P5338_09710 [Bacteroidales bacterium]|nr:hypothetical protein [Bacteroidales bacterium]